MNCNFLIVAKFVLVRDMKGIREGLIFVPLIIRGISDIGNEM